MHNLYIIGKNSSKKITQLWLVRELQNTLLVMIDKEYWEIKILIFPKTRNKLRDNLKTHGILKGTQDLASFNTELSILVKKKIVYILVKIILNKVCKTKVEGLLCNGTYFFMYDVKTTKLGEFSDLRIFYIKIFQVGTSITIEIQL